MNTQGVKTILAKGRNKLVWQRIAAGLVILVLLGGGFAGYLFGKQYTTRTQTTINGLKNEQTKLQKALQTQQAAYTSDKKTLEDALKANQEKIAALERQIVELEKKVAANRIAAAPKPVSSKSVYDRIVSDDPTIKQKLIDAIKLVETNTPAHFTILKNQVQEIRSVTYIGCGGGVQVKRTISISFDSADCVHDTPTSTFASVIVHEAYHVYNVYVHKVTTTGKAQELPSLYAQRDTFDALGVVQGFRDHISSLIAYYESL